MTYALILLAVVVVAIVLTAFVAGANDVGVDYGAGKPVRKPISSPPK